jgi:hypothetical protein
MFFFFEPKTQEFIVDQGTIDWVSGLFGLGQYKVQYIKGHSIPFFN